MGLLCQHLAKSKCPIMMPTQNPEAVCWAQIQHQKQAIWADVQQKELSHTLSDGHPSLLQSSVLCTASSYAKALEKAGMWWM